MSSVAAAGIVGKLMEMNVRQTDSLIGKDCLGEDNCL